MYLDKRDTMYRVIVVFISIISSILIYFLNKDNRYDLLYLLPLTYTFLYIIFPFQPKVFRNGVGMWAINITMFIRYIITPLTIVISDFYDGFGPEVSRFLISKSIYLMIYEMVALLFVINVIAFAINSNKNVKSNNMVKRNHILRRRIFLFSFTIIAFLIVSFVNPRVLFPNNFLIISESVEKAQIDMGNPGLILVLGNLVKITSFLLIIDIIKRKSIGRKETFYAIISVIVLIITMALHTGMGRWDILIIGISGYLILKELYPKSKAIFKNIIFTVILFSICSITIYKFIGTTTINMNTVYKMIQEVMTQFQVYFSGPRNVALSIGMVDDIGSLNFKNLIEDLFGSMPLISNFINQEYRMNTLYNEYIYGRPDFIFQIIPMVGIGFSVFGFVAAPILTICFELIVLWLDSVVKKTSDISHRFLCYYAIIFTSLCMGFNIQIITNKYYAFFIPLFVLLWLNGKIYFKKNILLIKSR